MRYVTSTLALLLTAAAHAQPAGRIELTEFRITPTELKPGDAFTIHAIPGYNFKVIDASFSSAEVKKWVDDDNKKLREEQMGEQTNKFTTKTFKGTRDKSEEMKDKWERKERE